MLWHYQNCKQGPPPVPWSPWMFLVDACLRFLDPCNPSPAKWATAGGDLIHWSSLLKIKGALNTKFTSGLAQWRKNEPASWLFWISSFPWVCGSAAAENTYDPTRLSDTSCCSRKSCLLPKGKFELKDLSIQETKRNFEEVQAWCILRESVKSEFSFFVFLLFFQFHQNSR
jgi:hypothetical protein